MNNWTGVHPELVTKMLLVLDEMTTRGHPMALTDGLRTVEQQQALYAKGRTLPGPIVTQCDGIHSKSNHQAHPDGWGHAVDCTFLDPHTHTVRWLDTDPWDIYGEAVEAQQLLWGGHWHSFPDRPHAELPS